MQKVLRLRRESSYTVTKEMMKSPEVIIFTANTFGAVKVTTEFLPAGMEMTYSSTAMMETTSFSVVIKVKMKQLEVVKVMTK